MIYHADRYHGFPWESHPKWAVLCKSLQSRHSSLASRSIDCMGNLEGNCVFSRIQVDLHLHKLDQLACGGSFDSIFRLNISSRRHEYVSNRSCSDSQVKTLPWVQILRWIQYPSPKMGGQQGSNIKDMTAIDSRLRGQQHSHCPVQGIPSRTPQAEYLTCVPIMKMP